MRANQPQLDVKIFYSLPEAVQWLQQKQPRHTCEQPRLVGEERFQTGGLVRELALYRA
jgi:hypothetical protein